MRETWRWFGPQDPVSLADARQAGAVGIVTALHHLPVGQEWNLTEIQRRQQQVRAENFEWEVVESLPVSEKIKTQKGLWCEHLSAWRMDRIYLTMPLFALLLTFFSLLKAIEGLLYFKGKNEKDAHS